MYQTLTYLLTYLLLAQDHATEISASPVRLRGAMLQYGTPFTFSV